MKKIKVTCQCNDPYDTDYWRHHFAQNPHMDKEDVIHEVTESNTD